jgi:putative DNA primase/helicase
MNDSPDFTPLTDEERAAAAENSGPKDDAGDLVIPIPADAPSPPSSHFCLGLPTMTWEYKDTAGATLLHIQRFDPPGGKKEFWPLTLWRDRDDLRWRWKNVPSPRPLYGLDRVAARPDAPVIVSEGEKAADAAAQIFPNHATVTSPGGAAAADTVDWRPLAGRQVTIWPDNDEHGAKYAREVAAKLIDIGCEVLVIDVAALAAIDPGGRGSNWSSEGWDAANGTDEWTDAEAPRREALNLAEPFDLGPAYIFSPPYTMDADGLAIEIEGGRGKEKRTESLWLAAPFEILGASRDPHGGAWGKTLRLIPTDECMSVMSPTPNCIATRRRFAPLWPRRAYGSIARVNLTSRCISRPLRSNAALPSFRECASIMRKAFGSTVQHAPGERLGYRLTERFHLMKQCSNLPFAFLQNEQLQ